MQVAFATPELVTPHRSRAGLIVVMVIFLVMRIPMMIQQQAGQDEAFFAAPGLMVSRGGIPSIPYLPARAESSVFYHADEVFNSIPPANAYWQSLFFLVLPDNLFTARMASATAGLIAILAIYLLGVRIFSCNATGLLAAALYSMSRLLFFPATSTRPDMLCGMLGLLAILAMWNWVTKRQTKQLIQTGVLLGIAMLTHFFALVFCLQIAFWTVISTNGKAQKAKNLGILAGSALLIFALWIPLIMVNTDISITQIQNNVFNRAGPGLFSRLIWPWESLSHHCQLLVEHAQLPQLLLMLVGILAIAQSAITHYHRSTATLALLTLSGMYLLCTISGVHPANGYWCYPGALLILCVSSATIRLLVRQPWQSSTWKSASCLFAILVVMIPGFGINAWITHVTNWNSDDHDREQITFQILDAVPERAKLIVDQSIAFDLYVAGRDVTLSSNSDFSIDSRGLAGDYLITGPLARQQGIVDDMHTEFVTSVGDPSDVFAMWIEVYRIRPQRRP